MRGELLALNDQVYVEVLSRLALEPQSVPNLAFAHLLKGHFPLILVVDEGVSLESGVSRLNLDFARVALASERELEHGNGQELGVGTDISWHGHLGVLRGIGISEVLESLWWVFNSSDWDVLDNQVSELKVRLSVLRAEEQLKINVFTTSDLALSRFNPVMSLLGLK